jgi:hypothetical protein
MSEADGTSPKELLLSPKSDSRRRESPRRGHDRVHRVRQRVHPIGCTVCTVSGTVHRRAPRSPTRTLGSFGRPKGRTRAKFSCQFQRVMRSTGNAQPRFRPPEDPAPEAGTVTHVSGLALTDVTGLERARTDSESTSAARASAAGVYRRSRATNLAPMSGTELFGYSVSGTGDCPAPPSLHVRYRGPPSAEPPASAHPSLRLSVDERQRSPRLSPLARYRDPPRVLRRRHQKPAPSRSSQLGRKIDRLRPISEPPDQCPRSSSRWSCSRSSARPKTSHRA